MILEQEGERRERDGAEGRKMGERERAERWGRERRKTG